MNCDLLIHNIHLATLSDNGQAYGAVPNGCIAIRAGKVLYAGPEQGAEVTPQQTVDGGQAWATPGLIDCHTHLIFGGNRAEEFEKRLQGENYASLASGGGGILSTVRATRAAGKPALLEGALRRARRLLAEGVTTLEVKSGYGLDLATEVAQLEVARQLAQALGIHIEATFLGAHAVPPEFSRRPDAYIDFVCQEVLPVIARQKLATSVDIFCESVAFSTRHARQLFTRAQSLKLGIKAHAEQLSCQGAARLAAEFGALSVDHLEYLPKEALGALRHANTVAVLLPGAFYYLQQKQKPPVEALRQQGIPMAVATDLNPGSSPMASLLTAMNMACLLFGLSPEEALRGATINAARALGLPRKGRIEKGCDADLCLWDISHPRDIVYAINQHRPQAIFIGGRHVIVE